MPFVAVTLLQSAKAILTQFDETLAQRAMENLQNEGVEVRTGVRVVQITDKQVVLKGGERIDYGLCVWSAGNMSRPLVQGLVDLIPEQAALQKGGPPTFKLATDPFLRVVGAKDVIAIGDCSNVLGQDAQLPPTAQVAAQQGAYAAHMINRGFVLGVGGMDRRAPTRVRYGLLQPVLPPLSSVDLDMDLSSYETAARNLRTASDADIEEYRRVFEFFNLGIMAYVGGDKAAIDTQVKVGEQSISVYGSLAFLLWRSVYLTKQVSLRNRVLILFDWLKAQVFGRDLSMF
ncbi:hypothetical protein FOA52_013405 [Chlamydomonas sp. UWO 241]|nr:hypothetical protein FOA52_013405 [Chlamydomonas sp. UWO 241]